METPIDQLVADMVSHLDVGLREEFEERSGIMEFDGKLPRAHAECLALLNVLHRHPSVLTGITVLHIEIEGVPQWLLITDLDRARRYLTDTGSIEIGVRNFAGVIREQFDGLAKLTKLSNPGRPPAPALFEHLI